MFICPVCRAPLTRDARRLACPAGHSFDLAKQGYVNLILSSRSAAKRRGDDQLMVAARQQFLDRGYYAPLRDAVCRRALALLPAGGEVLDIGCGECYYTQALHQTFADAGIPCRIAGIDISKTALMAGGRRCKDLELAVASVATLPLADASCDLLVNIFAPVQPAEFLRVLRPGGAFLHAVPLQRHLWGLKAAVYDTPYENPAPEPVPGFRTEHTEDIVYTATITPNEDIQALFKMTPYYYKTGARDQAKLATLDTLETELAFRLYTYRKA